MGIVASKNKHFRFLDLPPELRNRIYSFATVREGPFYIGEVADGYCSDRWESPKQPALLMVSKQIREESLPIFYGENTFVCHPDVMFPGFQHSNIEVFLDTCEPYLPMITSVGYASTRKLYRTVTNNDDAETWVMAKNAQKDWVLAELRRHEKNTEADEETKEVWRKQLQVQMKAIEDVDYSDPVHLEETDHYIVTASLILASDEVEICLEGDLEDQCVCSLPDGDWEDTIHGQRVAFIKHALKFCNMVLFDRMEQAYQICEECGDACGTIEDVDSIEQW